MAYIYKIINDINQKVYIGKTYHSIEERWREHCKDYLKEHCEKRPLYAAMKKYGLEHFHIEQVEEVDINITNLEDRERYWIEYYGSFKYGYNATLGGDGRRYCDYDLIFALFQEGKTIKEIANITHYDVATCRVALNNVGITAEQRQLRKKERLIKTVFQLDPITEEIVAVYSSIQDAYNTLGKQHSGHIAEVCKGKRKTAYGYKWKYKE